MLHKSLKDNKEKIIVSYCMGCGKIKFPGNKDWQYPELNLVNYLLSHGYCEPCGERTIAEAMAEIARLKKSITPS